MERLKDFFYDNRTMIVIGISLFLIVLSNLGQYYYFKGRNEEQDSIQEVSLNMEKENFNDIYVDIRGEVKKPGVYKMADNKRVIDAISISGGLTSNADTSVNNLGMQLKDEMVIIIYSKQEVKDFLKMKEIENKKIEGCQKIKNNIKNDSCVKEDNRDIKLESKSDNGDVSKKKVKEEQTIININTASLEELTTLTGIGEKKAQKIIEYRNNKPFETKEQIKEVSGIGESLYNKIKDYITI